MAANPPADHDAQAQRAHASGWFRQHWKEVLAVMVAIVPVAAYFVLRGQASSQGASNVLPSGTDLAGGAASSSSSPVTTAVQAVQGWTAAVRSAGAFPTYDPTHSGVPLWASIGGGNLLAYVPFGLQNLQILQTTQGSAPPGVPSGPTTWYQVSYGGQTGWISAEDLTNFLGGPAVSSNSSSQVFSGL